MSLRIYVAAPWSNRDVAATVARQLRDKGHVITHDWWSYEGEATNGMDPDDKFMKQCADDDYRAVRTADLLLLLNLQDRGKETSGKAVETGLALAWGIPIIMVGSKTNVFHYLPDIYKASSIENALEHIQARSKHGDKG